MERRISASDQFGIGRKLVKIRIVRAREGWRETAAFTTIFRPVRRSIPSLFSITIDQLRPLRPPDKSNESKFLRDGVPKDAFKRLENTREALEKLTRGLGQRRTFAALSFSGKRDFIAAAVRFTDRGTLPFPFRAGDLIFPSLLFSALDAGRGAALLCSRFDDDVVAEHASPALALRKSNSVRGVRVCSILW